MQQPNRLATQAHLLHVLLLASREVQKLLRILEKDSALRLSLRNIDTAREDGNFGVGGLVNGACRGRCQQRHMSQAGHGTHLPADARRPFRARHDFAQVLHP